MSNTINYLITDIYDSVSQAYKRDINHYEEILEHIYTAIDQKDKVLHRIKESITSLKKEIGTRKDVTPEPVDAGRSDEELKRSKNAETTAQGEFQIMCQYHPQAPAVDTKKQLCSSCSWKIKAYGLKEHLNDPAVVSYLKGENTSVPNVGQAMCPVHPAKPSYNKKTGLCQYCQSKARAIGGVTDRKLTDEELEIISGPVAW